MYVCNSLIYLVSLYIYDTSSPEYLVYAVRTLVERACVCARQSKFVSSSGAALTRRNDRMPVSIRSSLRGAVTLYSEPLPWSSAEASCVTHGGNLASIHSMEDNALISALCGSEECWIGFNDIAQEGTWVFSDGSAANFSQFPGGVAPWNPGEPNGRAEEATDGAYMYPSTNEWVVPGSWDDDDITVPRPYVCRHPPMPLPSPPPPLPPRPTRAGDFQFVAQALAYTPAEAHCKELGGHLASVRSLEENSMIRDLCAPMECWIGFNDRDQEGSGRTLTHPVFERQAYPTLPRPANCSGTWKWTDGSDPFDFSQFPGGVAPWNLNEPNGQAFSTSDGAYIYPSTNAWVRLLPSYTLQPATVQILEIGAQVVAGSWDDDDTSNARASVCRVSPLPPSPALPPRPTTEGPFSYVAEPADYAAAEAYCIGRQA